MKLLQYIKISHPLFHRALVLAAIFEATPLAVSLLVLLFSGMQPGGPVFIVLHLPGSILALPVGWWITDLPKTLGNLIYGATTVTAQLLLFTSVNFTILIHKHRRKKFL